MKPSNYEINSDYAHRAELGKVQLSLTIPANFTADMNFETTAFYNAPNALFRYKVEGADTTDLAIDTSPAIERDYNGIGILYRVIVYRINPTTIALCCQTNDGRTVTGDHANTITATVHFFESPFEA